MLCRVALAAVFGLAAWAKLTDFPRWRQSLDQHGLGPAVSGGVAWLVPVLEAGVAGGLLAPGAAWGAAVAALALLAVFTAAGARALATGRAARCACFGRWGRLGPRALARNVLFAVPAVVILVGS